MKISDEIQLLNCPIDVGWFDYPGALYHHKEDKDGTD